MGNNQFKKNFVGKTKKASVKSKVVKTMLKSRNIPVRINEKLVVYTDDISKIPQIMERFKTK